MGIEPEEFEKFYSKKDIEKIKKYKESRNNYIKSSIDYKKYRNQYCEKVAFDAGNKGTKKYIKLVQQINSQFPNTHHDQFHISNKQEDDISILNSILSAFRKK